MLIRTDSISRNCWGMTISLNDMSLLISTETPPTTSVKISTDAGIVGDGKWAMLGESGLIKVQNVKVIVVDKI